MDSNIEGKSVTLVDDSIVRGTTSRQLVKLLRESGASEVHFRVGSPPIVAPCYLGIDMASRDELMASDRSVEEIRDEIGADSLEYLTPDEIGEALDMPRNEMCTGCVTGSYPVEVEGERCERADEETGEKAGAD
jgi:amidophosphoribosyltransferase